MFMMFFFMFSVDSHRASLKIENPPVGLVVGGAQLLSYLDTIALLSSPKLQYHHHHRCHRHRHSCFHQADNCYEMVVWSHLFLIFRMDVVVDWGAEPVTLRMIMISYEVCVHSDVICLKAMVNMMIMITQPVRGWGREWVSLRRRWCGRCRTRRRRGTRRPPPGSRLWLCNTKVLPLLLLFNFK